MLRPTVNDIAREAGVSLATVDRVMNARPGVRRQTISRVTEAIERLGYVRDVAAANLARRRAFRAVFVLPDSGTSFLGELRAAIEGASVQAAIERMAPEIRSIPAYDPTACARALDALVAEGADGIALMAPETPQVRDAIRRVGRAGVPLVALVSDQPHSTRDRFVGIDAVSAGRTAGMLLGRFLGPEGGSVLVLAGSMMARDQMERRLGFDAVMRERFPAVTALPSIEGRDEAALVERLLPRALQAHPEARAVYSLGAGNRGLVRALRACAPARRLVSVAHDLTPLMREALHDGTIDAVITQDVGHLARSALRVLRAAADGRPIDPGQEEIGIEIVIRENLPRAGAPGARAQAPGREDAP